MSDNILIGILAGVVVYALGYLIYKLGMWYGRSKKMIPSIPTKKYILYGCNVQSKNDRQWHYISAMQLCKLYGLNPEDCFFYNDRIGKRMVGYPDLPILYPRSDGDYRLPLDK